MFSSWLRMENKEISKDKYGYRSIDKEVDVHICELEHDESDEKEEILDDFLI